MKDLPEKTYPKAIIFDFDGVLGRTMEDNFAAWRHAFAMNGARIKKIDYFLLEGMGPKGIALELCRKYRLPSSKADAIIRAKEEYYQKHNKFSLYPGVRELISWLRRRDIALAIVSGSSKQRFLKTFPPDLRRRFSVIITSDDIKITKPDPKPYLMALEKVGVFAHECAVIENAPLGIASAKAAGLFCVALTSTLPKRFLEGADVVISDIARTKQAIYSEDVRLSAKKIGKFLKKAFYAAGADEKTAGAVVGGLLYASLRGIDSHGIRLAPHYIVGAKSGRINPHSRFTFIKKGPAVLMLDADHGYGIAAGVAAMRRAVVLAKKYGVAAVVVKNSSHFGAAGIFSSFAAERGMIGLSFTHTDSLVIPFGGRASFLGTNPICFAAPVRGEMPFCLDMATTAISWNKLDMYKKDGKKLDRDWVVDKYGYATENPERAVSLTPLGGYKGYGLGLMVEILCSMLSGMPAGRDIERMFPISGKHRRLGHFFVAIDIKRFQPLPIFKKRMGGLLNDLRKQPAVRGCGQVLVAGDPEKNEYKIRSVWGIPVPSPLTEELALLAKKLSIKPLN